MDKLHVSQINSPCNEFTSFWSTFVYNTQWITVHTFIYYTIFQSTGYFAIHHSYSCSIWLCQVGVHMLYIYTTILWASNTLLDSPSSAPMLRSCPKTQLSGGYAPVSLMYGKAADTWSLNTAIMYLHVEKIKHVNKIWNAQFVSLQICFV